MSSRSLASEILAGVERNGIDFIAAIKNQRRVLSLRPWIHSRKSQRSHC
jgi:hypothetical protein